MADSEAGSRSPLDASSGREHTLSLSLSLSQVPLLLLYRPKCLGQHLADRWLPTLTNYCILRGESVSKPHLLPVKSLMFTNRYGSLQIPQPRIFLNALSQKEGMAGSFSLEWQWISSVESYKACLDLKKRSINLSTKELSGPGEKIMGS